MFAYSGYKRQQNQIRNKIRWVAPVLEPVCRRHKRPVTGFFSLRDLGSRTKATQVQRETNF